MSVTIAAVGDLVLDEPEPGALLQPSAGVLRSADLSIGHVEVPHSDSEESLSLDVPAPAADPAALAVLAEAGLDVVTLAGNHVYDAGTQGVLDTVRHAHGAGLLTAGAGADLQAAVAPAVTHVGGTSIAVLSFNCVGPRESWATSTKAGAAYVEVLTHYEPQGANPGGPPRIHTFADAAGERAMCRAVEAAAEQVDVVVIALHKGLVHTPAELAAYEQPLARAAVDAGADLVLGHHAHIMRGVEIYHGVPIFHGLGNFVTVTRALGLDTDSPERRAWASRRRALFDFEPDPAMPNYPFHPQSRHTAVAWCTFSDGILGEVALRPCWIDEHARPVPLTDEAEAAPVADYLRDITARAGLGTELTWHDDRLLVSTSSTATGTEEYP